MSGATQRPCILIVDDDEDVVAYLKTVFADNGYHPICTGGGDQVLELAREHRPDLICLDISMPPPTGVRVYRDLRDDPELRSIPIIMVTGVEREFEQFIKTRRQVPPPDGYHRKPFDVDELLATVRKILGESEETTH
jgi:DNA-binding response OmpR family regulator